MGKEEIKWKECGVCWGGGVVEYDDYGSEEDCHYCKGTGKIKSIEL